MVVSEFISKILESDRSGDKLARVHTVNEPAVGTGSMLLTQSNHSLCAIGIDINRDLLECALVQFALYAPWYYCPIWWLGNTDLICGNTLTLENFESINTKFWLPIFADIVKVELKPIDKQAYQESLKQTLQNSHPKNNVNPIVSNALNDKGSIPKIHQTSLFDYLK